MHKVFGIKENVEYLDREGAYLVPWHDNKVVVVNTSKGYFFLGGGLEKEVIQLKQIIIYAGQNTNN